MMMPPLALRTVEGVVVAALRRLGGGLRMPFEVDGQSGALQLEPACAPEGVTPLCFETACGVLAFGEPSSQLSLLGQCPVTLAQAGNDPDSWFWALFEHHLSPQVRALFGYLRLLPTVPALDFGCRLWVSLGASRVAGYLWMSAQSFLALCEAGPWQPTAAPMPDRFQLTLAVTLGRLRLSIAQMCSVREGDVVLLEHSYFQVQGNGYLPVGKQRLHGRIDDAHGPLCLTVSSIEETTVDEDLAVHHAPEAGDDRPVTDVFGHEPFDELSMALNVRCGTLNLSLGELRNLAPGAVLGITGYAPGMAGLYYGDRPIGQGQLVEVDGRLGLQLSRVMFSR
ncbi:type III secretion protein [Pseudomonas poae]|uniref:Type III secretion protein n=1 Tax=Pseudomonas poae TaxID=200451 RepID=A0A423FHE4_9PSED|nr:FliM/FliN family flagellar motor switch protein [Pseudomonas poae]ROM57446.1 type III secretion protein [Pseudomonas poae]